MHSDVTISILTHTQLEHAKNCLRAVLASRGDARLILTANENPKAAEFFRELEQDHQNITVAENPINQGFIAPNNWAFLACKTTYMVMLNDDAIPPHDWLDKLKEPFERDIDVAITGAKGEPSQLSGRFIGHRGPRLEYIQGSCMMVKTHLVRPLGLFADYLSMAYAEDADLCLRVRQAGYKIALADFELDFHARGATTKTVYGLLPHMQRNFAVCQRKWAHYLKSEARKFENER